MDDWGREIFHARWTGLRDRERQVLDLRYGSDGKVSASLSQVAAKLCVSRETVRVRERQGMATLRELVIRASTGSFINEWAAGDLAKYRHLLDHEY